MKTITKVWEDAVIAANVCKKKIVEVGMREELSVCEAPIMKIIWESNPDISVPELVKQLNEQYGKEYARTTVVTFLTRMAGKGYITTQRRGRISYVHAIKSEQEYNSNWRKRKSSFGFMEVWQSLHRHYAQPLLLHMRSARN